MKILIVTQYYFPENFKSNELSFELQKRGYDVTVLTGLPNYPEGKIYEGYGWFKRRTETVHGVKVIRTLLLPRGKGSGLRLFFNYYSFALFASWKAFLLGFREKYDAVIVHEPSPITQFYPALLLHKLHKTPVYYWVMDLWPESLEIAGGIKNKLVLNYFKNLATKFYRNSEKILITSKGFRESILEKGDFDEKIEYFPNWAENSIAEGRTDYPIPDLPDGFKVMFAGNIGESQDMETIMEAAQLLGNRPEIKLIIVGEGRKLDFVKKFVKEHTLAESVHIMGRYPVEAMTAFFSKADVMLVSLKSEKIFQHTVPAKVQAYMSAGKPIIAMLDGEGAEIIDKAKCGIAVPAGSAKGLSEAIIRLSLLDKQSLLDQGENGRNYFLEHFQLSSCISNLERIIKKRDS